MIHHMADDGRIAVLLPHGVLFRGTAELALTYRKAVIMMGNSKQYKALNILIIEPRTL